MNPVGEKTKATINYPACSALISQAMSLANPVEIESRKELERCCAAHPTLLAKLPFLDDLRRVEEALGMLGMELPK